MGKGYNKPSRNLRLRITNYKTGVKSLHGISPSNELLLLLFLLLLLLLFLLNISQKFSMAFFTTFERFQVYQILGIVSILHKRWSDAFLAFTLNLCLAF